MNQENTYFIDPANEAELTRLIAQDAIYNKKMDLVPQSFVPKRGAKILDLACGPGQWALAVGDLHPQVQVVGIDISKRMIAWAKTQVKDPKQVNFLEGNILNNLLFPDQFFDFINARFLFGLMTHDSWVPLVQECFRITKPGGIIRMTETSGMSSPGTKVHRMNMLVFTALWRAQKTFSPLEFGVAPLLGLFLEQGRYHVLEEKVHLLNFSYGTPLHKPLMEESTAYLQLIKPFLRKHLPKEDTIDLDAVVEETCQAMHDPDFRVHTHFTSVTGKKMES